LLGPWICAPFCGHGTVHLGNFCCWTITREAGPSGQIPGRSYGRGYPGVRGHGRLRVVSPAELNVLRSRPLLLLSFSNGREGGGWLCALRTWSWVSPC